MRLNSVFLCIGDCLQFRVFPQNGSGGDGKAKRIKNASSLWKRITRPASPTLTLPRCSRQSFLIPTNGLICSPDPEQGERNNTRLRVVFSLVVELNRIALLSLNLLSICMLAESI